MSSNPVFCCVSELELTTWRPYRFVSGKPLGALELEPLLIPNSTPIPAGRLQLGDVPSLLNDLAIRFTPSASSDYEGGLDEILLPLFTRWNSHLLTHKLDIGGGPAASANATPSWRDILQAVQSLSEIKLVAATLPTLPGWDLPSDQGQQQAPRLEYHTLLGPLLRLSTFPDGAVRPPSSLPLGCGPYTLGGELVRSRAPLPLTPKKAFIAASLLPRAEFDGPWQHRQCIGKLAWNAAWGPGTRRTPFLPPSEGDDAHPRELLCPLTDLLVPDL